MQTYAGHPAQIQYNDAAVVSTFVGDSFDWAPVKAGTNHSIWALPNLQDPAEATSNSQRSADGAFSWYAWPTDGGNSIISGPMTKIWDDRFISDLGNATYMAQTNPKTEDYGESHYIRPYSAAHSEDGSSEWASGFSHDAWRDLYKPYIQAYKAGASSPTIDTEEIVYWYRITPKGVTCTNDTLPAPNGIDLLSDSVFVATMLKEAATLIVTSGGNEAVSIDVPAGITTSNVTMGVGKQSFVVSRGGQTVLNGTGELSIVDTCETYNYNLYVGSVKA
ncbi:glucan endo-1,3-alpha-glucosidase agn1 precursor, putative [Talaromyces stipitatus ATCC 10500]|uniref:Glucan endo-1,3-alpha-glucosidase agn1, putative n=1 Tax=Talaromyces stipitatus (strain ATCC 10500 / CBS 375.48 / QM 6759 / NRRL 1006) TaxID=441959 RepID=B8MMY8_TALSN|nr:glucan endo-1,3-alpha-glucosidase agn1 precursor, putative [Talaromyces stipitatus ATCC 10500]EED13937.1 glucan endo-1,3-alpha-glucosidase agn1 precursor, putative [Talaromyces stipitatus ATCC 10500]